MSTLTDTGTVFYDSTSTQPPVQRPGLEINCSRHFHTWLSDTCGSLAFTTYQASKLFLIGTKPNGSLNILERTIDRCMGLAVHETSLYVSSQYQIWRFENILEAGQRHSGHDACFTPQMSYVTGDLDIHDMALNAEDELVFVNTLFGCLARTSQTASFYQLWQPPFLTKLAAEDRCHLNGLAMENGSPAYVTAVAETDTVDGWRDRRENSGVVIHVPTGETVAHGLSMPHSPRIKDGILYLLNSGTGEFGTVDPATGKFSTICFCPGYARGLTFVGNYAVIGLSLPRHSKTFQGLPLDNMLRTRKSDPRCGLIVVDLKTGDIVHWMWIDGLVTELYDVASLSGTRTPYLVGFKSDEIKKIIKVAKKPEEKVTPRGPLSSQAIVPQIQLT